MGDGFVAVEGAIRIYMHRDDDIFAELLKERDEGTEVR
jgi:hypothetical protein